MIGSVLIPAVGHNGNRHHRDRPTTVPAAPGPAVGRPARRRIVVAVDGSPGSAAALQRAASQARQRQASLNVVYVLPADAGPEACTAARATLGKFTRQALPLGAGVPVRLRIERGNPAVAVLLAGAGAELIIRHQALAGPL